MTITSDDHMSKASPVRRIEVFTGAGHRRRWSAEDKARIVAESFAGGDTVCAIARRHGLSPTQLFVWRRDARAATGVTMPAFAPVVIEVPPAIAVPAPAPSAARPPRRARRAEGAIELEIAGVTVKVGRGAEARTVAAVIHALKRRGDRAADGRVRADRDPAGRLPQGRGRAGGAGQK